jgi:transposase
MDRSALEVLLAQGLSLEEIGRRYGKDASTVGYWVAKHGLRAVHAEKFAPRGGLTREQLEPLAAAGLSLLEIADAVDRSIATVRHWLRKHDLEPTRRRVRRPDSPPDPGTIVMRACSKHGEVPHRYERRGYYRCRRCAQEYVADRRRRVKAILVGEAGGSCAICGYDTCVAALHFHHLDPAAKEFAVSRQGVTRAIAEVREEAGKCVLLCSNCHAEVENGVATVSA